MNLWSKLLYPYMKLFRKQRIRRMLSKFPEISEMTVLDIGGRPMIWNLMNESFNCSPQSLCILNLEGENIKLGGSFFCYGDGRFLPFKAKSFDLIFSNSVIEHIGTLEDIGLFSKECERVGKNIYLQTPNKWFPIEPHIISLFIHWFPRYIFLKLSFFSIRRISLVNNKELFLRIVKNINLLTKKDIKVLFPGKNIYKEKFFFMTKSFQISNK